MTLPSSSRSSRRYLHSFRCLTDLQCKVEPRLLVHLKVEASLCQLAEAHSFGSERVGSRSKVCQHIVPVRFTLCALGCARFDVRRRDCGPGNNRTRCVRNRTADLRRCRLRLRTAETSTQLTPINMQFFNTSALLVFVPRGNAEFIAPITLHRKKLNLQLFIEISFNI